MVWFAEAVRVTIFMPPTSGGCPLNWEIVTGTKAARIVQQPAEMINQEAGPFGKGQLLGKSQLSRYDWIYGFNPPNPTNPSAAFPNIGDFDAALTLLNSAAKKWPGFAQPVLRLAVGAVLIGQVKSQDEAKNLLAPLVPSVQLPDASVLHDFAYQVNRPRVSNVVRGLTINRLSKWQVLQAELLAINVALGQVVGAPTVSDTASVIRAEFDVNTSATSTKAIAPAEIPALLDELVALTKDMGIKGDVP